MSPSVATAQKKKALLDPMHGGLPKAGMERLRHFRFIVTGSVGGGGAREDLSFDRRDKCPGIAQGVESTKTSTGAAARLRPNIHWEGNHHLWKPCQGPTQKREDVTPKHARHLWPAEGARRCDGI